MFGLFDCWLVLLLLVCVEVGVWSLLILVGSFVWVFWCFLLVWRVLCVAWWFVVLLAFDVGFGLDLFVLVLCLDLVLVASLWFVGLFVLW